MTALAAAAMASLGKGAVVAVVVAAIGRAWRADARIQCGLATLGLWVIAAWFGVDLWLALSTAATPTVGHAAAAPAATGLAFGPDALGVPPMPPWVGWLYAAGVVGSGGRLAVGGWIVHRWRAAAVALPEALDAVLRWREIARALGLRRAPRFALSWQVASPMVVGVLAPLVIVPAAIVSGQPAGVSAAQLDALVAHELAHLARRDPWLSWLQRVIEVVLFHNPAVWWLGRRARRFREAACDDRAIAGGVAPIPYARALVAVAQLDCERLASTPALAATGGRLGARIGRIVSPRPAARPWRAALVTLACAAVLAVSGLRPAPERATTVARPQTLQIAWLPEAVRQHEPSILAAAARHGVDPALVAILTLVESGGDPAARSPLGATGLMQLMPATAAAAAGARGLPAPTADRLTDPAYNVELGTAVLAQHLATFGADTGSDAEAIARAVAAYNAGPQRVRAWLDRGTPLPVETQRYQAKVSALWARRGAPTRSAG